MYDSTNIAKRIKELAKSNNIIIKDMLKDCGLSKNALSTMISGGSTPKSENLARIADYLGCSVDYLLGREDNDLKELCGKETVIYNRDGRVVKTKLNEEQIKYLEKFIESLSGENHDHL